MTESLLGLASELLFDVVLWGIVSRLFSKPPNDIRRCVGVESFGPGWDSWDPKPDNGLSDSETRFVGVEMISVYEFERCDAVLVELLITSLSAGKARVAVSCNARSFASEVVGRVS